MLAAAGRRIFGTAGDFYGIPLFLVCVSGSENPERKALPSFCQRAMRILVSQSLVEGVSIYYLFFLPHHVWAILAKGIFDRNTRKR